MLNLLKRKTGLQLSSTVILMEKQPASSCVRGAEGDGPGSLVTVRYLQRESTSRSTCSQCLHSFFLLAPTLWTFTNPQQLPSQVASSGVTNLSGDTATCCSSAQLVGALTGQWIRIPWAIWPWRVCPRKESFGKHCAGSLE